MIVRHINPEGLVKNPAFTQVISVEGPHRTVYVGGQNAVDANRRIVGKGDLGAQSEQAFRNLQVALAAASAKLEDVVRLNIHILQGHDLRAGLAGSQKVWGNRQDPPAISVLYVAGLAHPDFLIEVDAVAVTRADGASRA